MQVFLMENLKVGSPGWCVETQVLPISSLCYVWVSVLRSPRGQGCCPRTRQLSGPIRGSKKEEEIKEEKLSGSSLMSPCSLATVKSHCYI